LRREADAKGLLGRRGRVRSGAGPIGISRTEEGWVAERLKENAVHALRAWHRFWVIWKFHFLRALRFQRLMRTCHKVAMQSRVAESNLAVVEDQDEATCW